MPGRRDVQMRPSRGMGIINPSKMPKAKTITRKDDPNKVKMFAEGGESKVNEAGNYTKPGMRKRLFESIKAGGKGGAPGQWSARKAQMLALQYKKSAILAAGGFDERYIRAQDWELNHRMRAQGGLIWFDPRLVVTYRPRKSLSKLAKQYFQYGRWRRVISRQHPKTTNFRYLAPPVALVINLLSVVFGVLVAKVFYLPVLIYMTLLIIGGLIIGRKTSDKLLMPIVFATMHLSWGAGFLTSPKKLFKN